MRLELGNPVRCADGAFGELVDVVIDPTQRRLTHLVVQPRHRDELVARLVPIELAEHGGAEEREIRLRCTAEEVEGLAAVQELAYLELGQFPLEDERWDVGVTNVLAMPYYEQAPGDPAGLYEASMLMSYDRIPKGEVEIRRGSDVESSDGHRLGEVDGFLVDGDEHITHVVLERGHLWGRREITIPIGSVSRVDTDSVAVALTKDEVEALPSARVHRWRS
jgi:sporulation protein YlmC with PRC-barrel domain